ncbi:MAG: DUF1573 domain-containing protein [Odoribacter sp.]|nr:DUF1573 domain-containing protein [Odoribacter sp.]
MNILRSAVYILIMCISSLPAVAEASVRWLETVHNFGAFAEETGPVSCKFKMVNDGPGAASIVAARATCGCTQPRYDVRSLAPGDTAELSVTFDPQGRPGRFTKQIYVETSGTPQKQKLEITGVVIGAGATVARRFPVDMGPLKLATGGIMLGEVTKGHLKTIYTEGYNRSADSLRVTITRKPGFVEIIPSPAVAAPGEQITLISYLNSAKCPLYGLVEEEVTISPVPGQEYTIPLTVIINEDFSSMSADDMKKAPISVIGTEIIDLGTVDQHSGAVTASFTIGNAGKNKLSVRRVYSSDPGVAVNINSSSPVAKGKKATVTVSLDPAAVTGDIINAKVIVITNDPLQPSRTVRLVGNIKK